MLNRATRTSFQRAAAGLAGYLSAMIAGGLLVACSGGDQNEAGHRQPAAANEQVFSEILERGLNEADPRLAGMTRLTDEEIRQAIVGRTIVEDRPPGTGMPFLKESGSERMEKSTFWGTGRSSGTSHIRFAREPFVSPEVPASIIAGLFSGQKMAGYFRPSFVTEE